MAMNTEKQKVLKQVGYRIAQCRDNLGMTQETLAHGSETDQKSLHRYETGETEMGIIRLKLIAETLNVSPSFLLSGKECEDNTQLSDLISDLKRLPQEQLTIVVPAIRMMITGAKMVD